MTRDPLPLLDKFVDFCTQKFLAKMFGKTNFVNKKIIQQLKNFLETKFNGKIFPNIF